MILKVTHYRKSDGKQTEVNIDADKLNFIDGFAVAEYTINDDASWDYSSFIGGWLKSSKTYRGILSSDHKIVLPFDTYTVLDNCGKGNFIITGLGHGGDGEQVYAYIWARHMRVTNKGYEEVHYFNRADDYQNLGNGIVSINGKQYDVNLGTFVNLQEIHPTENSHTKKLTIN